MRSLIQSTPRPRSVKEKLSYQLGRVATQLVGAVQPKKQANLPRQYNFEPHVFFKRNTGSHYGVMIPDLPEPFRYMCYASVLGEVGTFVTHVPPSLSKYPAHDTATLIHGTALSTSAQAFRVYSIKEQIRYSKQPFRIDFASGTSLFEQDGVYHLQTKEQGFEVNLTLTPTSAMTWFSYSSIYQHFSLLMQYQGYFVQDGQRVEISGLSTMEHWKVNTSMLPNIIFNGQHLMPLDCFSYQVINLDAEQQLVLVYIGFAGQPAYTAVSYRHIDGHSIQYDGDIEFRVQALKTDAMMTPDGVVMEVPHAFRWVAHHQGEKVLDLLGVVDTPYCYGVAAGYVTSYQWSGQFNGEDLKGRGYMEYSDRRREAHAHLYRKKQV